MEVDNHTLNRVSDAIYTFSPTKASFTSLSSRLGELVAGLHLKLQSLLSSPALSRHLELLVALLKLAATLGANSPYRRMARPLAQPLASVVAPFLQASGMLERSVSLIMLC